MARVALFTAAARCRSPSGGCAAWSLAMFSESSGSRATHGFPDGCHHAALLLPVLMLPVDEPGRGHCSYRADRASIFLIGYIDPAPVGCAWVSKRPQDAVRDAGRYIVTEGFTSTFTPPLGVPVVEDLTAKLRLLGSFARRLVEKNQAPAGRMDLVSLTPYRTTTWNVHCLLRQPISP